MNENDNGDHDDESLDEFLDYDIPEVKAIMGLVSRSWRMMTHNRRTRRECQNMARRRMRRAVRQAIRKGNGRDLPEPFSNWCIL